jgi:hypothetical protein
MLDLGVREVCVEDAGGQVIGVLTVEQIAGGENSPFGLRHALAHARDEEALVRTATAGLPRLLESLLSAGLAPADIGACSRPERHGHGAAHRLRDGAPRPGAVRVGVDGRSAASRGAS